VQEGMGLNGSVSNNLSISGSSFAEVELGIFLPFE